MYIFLNVTVCPAWLDIDESFKSAFSKQAVWDQPLERRALPYSHWLPSDALKEGETVPSPRLPNSSCTCWAKENDTMLLPYAQIQLCKHVNVVIVNKPIRQVYSIEQKGLEAGKQYPPGPYSWVN